MPTNSTISAVIPVHNGEKYVEHAIDSVLRQSSPVMECIVVDDGSGDGTGDLVASFGSEVRYIRQQQTGVSAARNRGATAARGELVAFLDHDDVWLPTKLERQMEVLDRSPAMMCICAVQVIDERGAVRGIKRLRPTEDLVRGMLMFDGTETVSCSSTGVVRREEFLRMGAFDPRLGMSADWDLLMRAALAAPIAYVDEPLALYRVHGTNMSHSILAMELDMKRAFAKTFADPRLPTSVRKRRRHAYGRLYRMLAGSYAFSDQPYAAARCLIQAASREPGVLFEVARHQRRERL